MAQTSTASDLFRSIKTGQFATARDQFSAMMQGHMRVALAKEYRSVAKQFLAPPPKPGGN